MVELHSGSPFAAIKGNHTSKHKHKRRSNSGALGSRRWDFDELSLSLTAEALSFKRITHSLKELRKDFLARNVSSYSLGKKRLESFTKRRARRKKAAKDIVSLRLPESIQASNVFGTPLLSLPQLSKSYGCNYCFILCHY